jgi:hypothetical protein
MQRDQGAFSLGKAFERSEPLRGLLHELRALRDQKNRAIRIVE